MINNKSISLFSIFALIILIFSTAYYTSESYQGYKEVQGSIQHITLIDKLDMILHTIEEEKSYSAIYMESKKEIDAKSLKVYREKIKNEIESVQLYIDKNLKFISYKKILEEMLVNLNRRWSDVDALNKSYKEETYYTKMISTLISTIEVLVKEANIKQSIKATYYIELLNLEENLNREENFISFILSSSRKMVDEDLLVWEGFIQNDITPNFSKLEDGLLRIKLNSLIDSKYFSVMGEEERAKIFVDSIKGDYVLSVKDWSDLFRKKMDRVGSVEEMILSDIKVNIDKEIVLFEDRLFKYIIIFTFLFILFLILLYIYSNMDKNSRFLSDTLKEIEADLDEKQKREINEVIKKNDTIEIYKFLANAIKEPSRAKDHFLANMSHEIRTPLNGIIGFTNILKETELKEDQREFIAIIEESSNNLITIVNDILDFSKVTSGKVKFENVSFNVMEKFEASIETYAAKAAEKNIDLSLYIDPNLPLELKGDSTKISQVIINLLSNAIKFTEAEGKVKVYIEKHSETDEVVKVKFSVKDTGIGISKEQQGKIFDAFSQADASTNRKFGGTGLGLTISSKFVALMGGELNIESEEGEGTTFFFAISLDKSEKSEVRIAPKLDHLNVVYITGANRDTMDIDKNLEMYVHYSGAKLKIYSYSEIIDRGTSLQADILFVEHKAIQNDEEMRYLLRLNCKVVLLTTIKMATLKATIKDEISKVLYKPINFSKTMMALKLAEVDRPMSHKKVAKVNNIKSNKVFEGVNALVAEDNLINQKLIKNILNKFDITVTLANNGAEAVALYKENSYDIIFMDIQMPIMSGVEATKEILKYEQSHTLEHVPIVALTANVIENDKEKYLASGLDRYLKKPLDVKELIVIIEEYFPIESLRDSLHLESQKELKESEKSHILLYKETELIGKIYTAVLNNLGYKVDTYSNGNEFLEQLDNKEYGFALFDAKPFRMLNSEKMVVDLIRDCGATPIAFVEKDNDSKYCATLKSVESVQGIEDTLLCS